MYMDAFSYSPGSKQDTGGKDFGKDRVAMHWHMPITVLVGVSFIRKNTFKRQTNLKSHELTENIF